MRVIIKPTDKTLSLLKKFKHSDELVAKAKRAGLVKASNIFRLRAIEKAPHRKGTLRKSILTEVKENIARVYSNLDYALFQEMGTGIYGIKKRMIRPKRAKFLRFKTRSGKIVFARKVRGVKPKWFMRKGAKYLSTQTKVVSDAIFNTLQKGLV